MGSINNSYRIIIYTKKTLFPLYLLLPWLWFNVEMI